MYFTVQLVALYHRRIFALRENVTTATWQRQELCMGVSDVCTGDLVGVARKTHVTSFGEDEDGELYILAVDDATPTTTDGVVYQLVDPARYICSALYFLILKFHFYFLIN